jgi:hypothetical protein
MKFVYLSIVLLAVGCGKNDSSSDPALAPSTQRQQEELFTEGKYEAILRPLNTSVSGLLPTGKARIELKGDELKVETFLDDDASVSHIQSIHTGTECPELRHDQNADGLVDINEMYLVTGKVLIPLDGDLAAQDSGALVYPKGSGHTYKRDTSFSKTLSDLQALDQNPTDHLAKLGMDEGSSLIGKVVVIHGTANKKTVPSTVGSAHGLPNYLTIPVVCGKIVRVN